jgi:AraC-like DNA-binding protein
LVTPEEIAKLPASSAFLRYYGVAIGEPHWFLKQTAFASIDLMPPAITIGELVRIVSNIVQFGDQPTYHLDLMQMGLPVYRGGLEIALRYAPTLRAALGLLVTHGRFRPGYQAQKLEIGTQSATVEIVPQIEYGAAAAPLVETPLLNLRSMLLRYVYSETGEINVTFRHASHTYVERLNQAFRCPVHFGEQRDAICFPRGWLDRTSLMHDPAAWAMGVQRCEEETRELSVQRDLQDIKLMLWDKLYTEARLPRLKETAKQYGHSPRTLIRRLVAQGTSFQAVCDQLQQRRAIELMTIPGISAQAVSEGLGFADSASCRRAFKRWFGMTPGQMMERAAPSQPARRP